MKTPKYKPKDPKIKGFELGVSSVGKTATEHGGMRLSIGDMAKAYHSAIASGALSSSSSLSEFFKLNIIPGGKADGWISDPIDDVNIGKPSEDDGLLSLYKKLTKE